MTAIVHAYFLCYNEGRILPHLLKYYSQFCQQITIIDSNSTDNTQEICSKYPNVKIDQVDTNNSINDVIFTSIKNNAWKKSRGVADYVIMADADEFLCHTSMPMADFIDEAKQKNHDLFDTVCYDMVSEENSMLTESDDIFKFANRGIPNRLYAKRILFSPKIEMNYAPGCHRSHPANFTSHCIDSGLIIKHFKYLGLEYFTKKMLSIQQRLSAVNKQHGWGGSPINQPPTVEACKIRYSRVYNASKVI